jgi:glycosyltransferase involved in cell wall biosynthesis
MAVSSESPKVLHVITGLGVGGVEVWLIALLEHMQQRVGLQEGSDKFHILLTGGKRAELDDRAMELGAQLHYIRFSRREFGKFAKEFRKLMRRERFTAIHNHQDYSGAWHFLAGAGLLPPVRIIHVHNPPICLQINTNTRVRKALFRVSRATVQRMATHVLGTSAQVLREYGFTSDVFPNQVIRAVHCGFEVAAFAATYEESNTSVCREFGWPSGSKICLFVGRLEGFDPGNPDWNHKNPEFAIEVIRSALDKGADTRLIVAGAGDRMRHVLEQRVTDWGYSDRISFAGPRNDVGRLMAASYVCLFPSLEEGLGMVAVEAQAAGLRVLASDTVPHEAAAIPELVSFLSLSETPSLWAEELIRLLSLPRLDSRVASATMRQTDFSIDRSYAQLQSVYSSVSPASHRQ